jgi:malic enzyme
MFAAAAVRLACEVSAPDFAEGMLFPPQSQIRRVSRAIAEAVVRQAREDGVASRVLRDEEIPRVVAESMWEPAYPRLVPA